MYVNNFFAFIIQSLIQSTLCSPGRENHYRQQLKPKILNIKEKGDGSRGEKERRLALASSRASANGPRLTMPPSRPTGADMVTRKTPCDLWKQLHAKEARPFLFLPLPLALQTISGFWFLEGNKEYVKDRRADGQFLPGFIMLKIPGAHNSADVCLSRYDAALRPSKRFQMCDRLCILVVFYVRQPMQMHTHIQRHTNTPETQMKWDI